MRIAYLIRLLFANDTIMLLVLCGLFLRELFTYANKSLAHLAEYCYKIIF